MFQYIYRGTYPCIQGLAASGSTNNTNLTTADFSVNPFLPMLTPFLANGSEKLYYPTHALHFNLLIVAQSITKNYGKHNPGTANPHIIHRVHSRCRS